MDKLADYYMFQSTPVTGRNSLEEVTPLPSMIISLEGEVSNPKPRILLVVPDLTRQRLVRTALSRCGAFVSTEESGEAALRRCAASPPRAVTVAVVLCGINWLQVMARLRTDYPTLPVYLMDDEPEGRRMDAGARPRAPQPSSRVRRWMLGRTRSSKTWRAPQRPGQRRPGSPIRCRDRALTGWKSTGLRTAWRSTQTAMGCCG
jgi:CheY-like chemotaxis protein